MSSSSQNPAQAPFLSIHCSPPILNSLVKKDSRNNRIVKCDVEADLHDYEQLRFDVNWIFDRFSIRKKTIRQSSVKYIACTACEISLYVENSELMDFSKGKKIPFSHNVETVRSRNCSSEINPSMESGINDFSVSISGLKLSYAQGTRKKYVTSLATDEHILATKADSQKITWDMQKPATNEAIRHYLWGNIFLEAIFHPKRNQLSGILEVKPRNVAVFSGAGEPISPKASWAVIFYLWSKKILSIDALIPEDRILLSIDIGGSRNE